MGYIQSVTKVYVNLSDFIYPTEEIKDPLSRNYFHLRINAILINEFLQRITNILQTFNSEKLTGMKDYTRNYTTFDFLSTPTRYVCSKNIVNI